MDKLINDYANLLSNYIEIVNNSLLLENNFKIQVKYILDNKNNTYTIIYHIYDINLLSNYLINNNIILNLLLRCVAS